MSEAEWGQLQSLAYRLSGNGVGPGGILDNEWITIDQALNLLIESESWEDVIKLREMFGFLINGETTGGMPVVMKLNDTSILAAEKMEKKILLAQYLHDNAENYHRKGYHKESVRDFERSALLYKQENEIRKSLESYYFSSLAYRALGKRKHALSILEDVLTQLSPDDPWRANPLEVLSWIYRDEEQYSLAEQTLKTALSLYRKLEGYNSVHAVQTLADMGEVLGLQGKFDEAVECFTQSLKIVSSFNGQYDRQEARTKIKYAELLINKRDYHQALSLLNEADDKVRGYGHYYDTLLRIELARAFAFWGLQRWGAAYRKIQLVIQYRNEIGLPYIELLKRIAVRTKH
ncbi:MAG: tetratricopeptide repeat protein [Candidatus Omnitrophica bacterium]|nr:tetratricopeptide repeat protein [Candidatus Omnitrophota bacterium]